MKDFTRKPQTGAYCGVAKCAEIVLKSRKMVASEELQVFQERMKTMGPDLKEIFQLLEKEQVDGIKTNKMCNRVKEEVTRRMKTITN